MIPGVLDILAARRRIRGHVDVTPLRESAWLSSIAGSRVSLKLECVQRTGSFKIRGAFNALIRLEPAKAGPHDGHVRLKPAPTTVTSAPTTVTSAPTTVTSAPTTVTPAPTTVTS